MKNLIRTTLALLMFAGISIAAPAFSESPHCTECGMMVDAASHFSARYLQGDKFLPFCDIGDLLTYLKKKGLSSVKARVRDVKSGEWLEAGKAWYVQSEKIFKTPMGWGIAAFKDRKDAETFGTPLEFSALLKRL